MDLNINNNTGQHPLTNGRSSLTWLVLALLAISGGWFVVAGQSQERKVAAASVAPPPPVPLKSGDDPAYDWERPGRPQKTDSGDWTPYIKPTFASSRTLQQTANWLSWALLSYGRVQEAADLFQISDVRFAGCSMQWDEKRFMDEGQYMNETIYTVNLGELDLTQLRAESASLHISTLGTNGVRRLQKLWEKDGSRMKLRAAERSMEDDSSAQFQLQEKDDISRRAGWAIVHASNLCGGKVSK
jgi:hypothetical protein